MHTVPDWFMFLLFWSGFGIMSIVGAYTGFVFGLGTVRRFNKLNKE